MAGLLAGLGILYYINTGVLLLIMLLEPLLLPLLPPPLLSLALRQLLLLLPLASRPPRSINLT